MTIMGRLLPVMAMGECGGATNSSIRDSLLPVVTEGTEVNNAQSQSRRWIEVTKKKFQDLLEQMQRQQDLVWKRLIDASATAYNDSFLFNTLNVRAAA